MATSNAFQVTELIIYSDKGHLPVVQLLLQHGADVNAKDQKGMGPSQIASNKGKSSVVNFLTQRQN